MYTYAYRYLKCSVIEESYISFKEDVLGLKQKGRVVLFGDVNAKVFKSTDVDWDMTCNASGNKLFWGTGRCWGWQWIEVSA